MPAWPAWSARRSPCPPPAPRLIVKAPARRSTTISSSAPASPARCSPSGSPASTTRSVLVIDKRPHVAGNAYDHLDEAGVLIHQYGPHIFHTNSRRDRRLSVAVHRLAALRASRARRGARPAGADPDQPDDAQQAVRPRPQDRRGGRRLSRLARRAGRRDQDLRGRGRSRRSGASSTSCSSRAIPASNGASTRASSTSR